MRNRSVSGARLRTERRRVVVGGAAVVSGLLSIAPVAFADTYAVDDPTSPYTVVGIGTNGDDAPESSYSVSQGGCTGDGDLKSNVSIAIGESNRACTGHFRWHNSGSEAAAWTFALGLAGADAASQTLAVSDSGDASGQCTTLVSSTTACDLPAAAVSLTGSAWGPIAVSGTGPATSEYSDSGYTGMWFGVAASGTGHASADNPLGVAISGTGTASGSTLGVSVLGGRKAAGTIAFRGRATLPQFPCPNGPGIGCDGSFAGDWTGHVAGSHHGSLFEANWTTTTSSGVGAAFKYWELACLAGVETLAGQADGTGSASAAANQVFGFWLERGETGTRAIIGASLTFTFHWTRSADAAVLLLEPTALTLDVAGLGPRTVATGLQTGTAAFALTSADNTTVPTCATPLTNAKADVVGNIPLSFVG